MNGSAIWFCKFKRVKMKVINCFMMELETAINRFKNFLYITYLNTVYYLFSVLFQRKFVKSEKNLGVEIFASGLLGTKNWNHAKALSELRRSHELLDRGNYFDGVNRLIAFHESQYDLFADSNGDFYPPMLSREWTNAFGHIPNIGGLIKLKEKGYVERIPDRAILSSGAKNVPILETFGREIIFLPDQAGFSTWSQLPSFIHLFLGQNIIWTKKSGFIAFEWLLDKLYSEVTPAEASTLKFELPSEYIRQEQRLIGKLGFFDFSEEEWFITIHIRNSGDSKSKIRNFEIDTFQELIDEVGRQGGKVVRICNESTPALPTRDFVLDCAKFPDRLRKSHLYFIAKCKVFVGTSSGPYAYPKLFGTPSLVVNATNIGRSCLPSSSFQEYLPMRFSKNGRELSLADMLESPAGWADCSQKVLAKMNLQPLPNSSSEISEAFTNFNQRLSEGHTNEVSRSQARVNDIRSKFAWTSSGNISESFLSNNQSWLS
jgi:putative glycosyltransferase (TIGR04372 family)